MATETFYWFQPDSNLRSAYGGGAIQNYGDSAELTPATLAHRWVSKQLGLPADATRYLWRVGAASGVPWIRVPALNWTALSAHLSASEVASAVTTIPSGFALNSLLPQFQPDPKRLCLVWRGDSLGAGQGTTTGDIRDTWMAQALLSLDPKLALNATLSYREGSGDTHQLLNISLGGSNWANTVVPGGGADEASYPLREDLAFAQRTQTLALTGRNVLFGYALGTNDLNYDPTLTGADAWARAATRIAAFRAEFPNVKLALTTQAKRSEQSSMNNRINDYNVLARANYASAGVDYLFDIEARVPVLNITTGNTGNATYYADDVHWTTATHTLVAAEFEDDLQAALTAA